MTDIVTEMVPPESITTEIDQPAQAATTLSVGQGPAGPPGPPGATLRGTAAVVLNGHRAVSWSAGLLVHADPSSPDLSHSCAGIIEQSAQVGETVPVRADGVVTFSGWAWAPGPVWFGADGVLTQIQPAGRSRVIGFGVGSKLNVCLQPPIDIAT